MLPAWTSETVCLMCYTETNQSHTLRWRFDEQVFRTNQSVKLNKRQRTKCWVSVRQVGMVECGKVWWSVNERLNCERVCVCWPSAERRRDWQHRSTDGQRGVKLGTTNASFCTKCYFFYAFFLKNTDLFFFFYCCMTRALMFTCLPSRPDVRAGHPNVLFHMYHVSKRFVGVKKKLYEMKRFF